MADAGRVIAGTARGLRLQAPGEGTRPLADRVKETLFAILEPELPGAVFVDLFAGSGAGGIEALSRGAERAVFVERDTTAVRTIEANLRRARFPPGRAAVVRADVLGWLAADARAVAPFDIVLVDPPYDRPADLDATLERLGRVGSGKPLLAAGARVVAKHFWRRPPAAAIGLLASERERRFGETTLTFYRAADPAARPTVEEGR